MPRARGHRLSNAPSAPREQQVDDHHRDGHRRERGREREVVRDADVDVDDVADELRARDERRRDVVAERQREGEDRAGRDRGQREREDDAPERPAAVRAEVGGRLEQRGRDPLEPGVDRQDHERQPEIREDEPGGDVAEAWPGEAERREHPVEHALLLQDHPPGVDLDEVARPEREQDRDDEQVPRPRRRDLRHVEGDREREHGVGDRHRGRDQHRPLRDRPVDVALPELLEVLEAVVVDDLRR